MKKLIKLLFVFAAFSFLTVQCEDDDDNTINKSGDTILVDTSIVLNASNQTTWKYYSFEKGDTVKISDPANSTDWDIAFLRNKVKTNGGKSGKGQAGAFKSAHVGQSGFDAIREISDTVKFVTDDSVSVYGYNPANPAVPKVTKEVLNGPLYDWYNLQQGAASTLEPKNQIYIFRTANGKFAKLWIKSYYSNEGTSGYFTIVYKYQKDGSKNLEK